MRSAGGRHVQCGGRGFPHGSCAAIWIARSRPSGARRGSGRRSTRTRRSRMRRQWEREKAEAGFAGIDWPVEYGGRGGTPGMQAVYDQEMIAAGAPRSANGLGLNYLAPTLAAIGTDRAEAGTDPAVAVQRHHLGAGLQRTRRRLGPGRDPHQRRARRRRVRRERSEDLDHPGQVRRPGLRAGPHRTRLRAPRGAVAAADRHPPARRRGTSAQDDERRGGVRRTVLHRCPRARRRLRGRHRQRLAHGDAAAVVRARRVRVRLPRHDAAQSGVDAARAAPGPRRHGDAGPGGPAEVRRGPR